ncbi:MAG: hypothetical protein GX113_10275 [Actinobacteria bacterium]|nr:hypothetical protein [Actinomycetota bacterium]
MRLLKAVSVILGVLLALTGVLSAASGVLVLVVDRLYSDSSGFFSTATHTVGSNGFVLTVPDVNGQLSGRWQSWGLSHAQATVRVTGSSRLPTPVFIGVAPTAQVSKYVSGVARDRITSIDLRAGSVEYDHVDGTVPPGDPAKQDIWVAKVGGAGSQTLEWELQDGDWALLVMNGDASAPVAVDVRLSARFDIIEPLIIGLMAGGVAVLALGIVLLVFGTRRRYSRDRTAGVHPAPR